MFSFYKIVSLRQTCIQVSNKDAKIASINVTLMSLLFPLHRYFPAENQPFRQIPCSKLWIGRRDYYTNIVLNVLKIENEDITATSHQTSTCSQLTFTCSKSTI